MKPLTKNFWQKPRLFDPNFQGERKITWLELFFDLVFVLVISELTHLLALDVSFQGIINFIILFFPAWWVWMGSVYYHDRFDVDNLERRLFTFLLMIPCFGFAIYAHHFADNFSTGFACSYIFARIIIIGMWLRGMAYEQKFLTVGITLIAGYTISIAIFLVSLLFPFGERLAIWLCALVCDMITPLLTLKGQKVMPHFSTVRLAERLGLFILLVLGEMLVNIVRGVARHRHFSLKVGIEGSLAFLISCMVWWIYFDHIASKHPRAKAHWTFLWSYLHFPVVISIAGIGSGMGSLLTARHHIPKHSTTLLLTYSVALCLIALAGIEKTLVHKKNIDNGFLTDNSLWWSRAFKIIAALAMIFVGTGNLHYKATTVMMLILLVLLLPFMHGMYLNFHRE